MLNKKILVFATLVFTCFVNTSFAYNQTEIKLVYDKFYLNVEKKYNTNTDKLNYLTNFNKKLETVLKKTKNPKNVVLLSSLKKLNENKVIILKKQVILSGIEKNSENLSSQTITDKKEVIKIENNPNFINNLVGIGYKYLDLNNNYEYIDAGQTFRFNIEKYYKIDGNNYKYFQDNKLNNGYIVKFQDKYFLTNEYSIEKKYNFLELQPKFKNVLISSNPYTLIGDEYVSYKYTNYLSFPGINGFYLSDLEANSINFDTTLLVKNGDEYYFVNDYKKYVLIKANLIDNITNKDNFLKALFDDNNNISSDYSSIILDIKNQTQSIISGKNTIDEKTEAIYNWIVKNINYYQSYSDGTKEIFSGVLTFKNKIGVCDGYSKLFLYMASFAGIDGVSQEVGYAIDSSDFPTFGHAWNKVGNYYYDTTFDDPIGGDDSYKYKFYKIPKDLMYYNKITLDEITDNLKQMSLSDRKLLVMKKLYDLYDKYNNDNYLLLNGVKYRKILNLSYNENPTVDKLKNVLKYYEVNGFSYIDENGNNKKIKTLKYYPVNNDNISIILENGYLDTTKMVLLNWNNNGVSEYRLAYDLILY